MKKWWHKLVGRKPALRPLSAQEPSAELIRWYGRRQLRRELRSIHRDWEKRRG